MVELYYWLSRTMLIERLVGVGLYAGLLLVMYLAVRSAKDYRGVCRVLNTYTAMLVIMAFFYIPGEMADLSRWRSIFVEYWSNLTFGEFVETQMFQSATPVSYFLLYIFQKTGVDGLLPAFCALVFYGNVFYVFKDLHCRHGVSTWSIAETMVFFMSAGCLVELISNVRCLTALSILGRCFYNEMYNGKSVHKGIVWELIAGLMHSLAVVLLAMRLFFLLFQSSRTGLKRLVNLILVAGTVAVIVLFGLGYVQFAAEKALNYINDSESYAYLWEYIVRGFLLVPILLTVLGMEGKKQDSRIRDILSFCRMVLLVDVVFCFNYSIFHRVNTFVIISVIPLMSSLMDQKRSKHWDSMVRFISVCALVFALLRGNMSGYKFFRLYR